MPELPVDMAVANRFISSLSKSLQALCHGCMDFDSGIEIVGYININIDSGSKVDYVLNEKVLKSTNNSMTFVSNSFLAKKDQPRPTRDGSCSPILGLSFQGQASPYHSRTWGPHPGSQYQRSSAQFSPHSQVLHGPQKRQWAGDWRSSSKKQKSQGSSETYMSQNSAYSHLPSSQSDTTFKHPLLPPLVADTDAASDTENQFINIKKEALDGENEQASTQDPEHSTSEPTDDLNSDSTGKLQIKCDPDGSEANETEFSNEAGSSTTDFKGTFLEPSDTNQNTSEQNNDPSAPFESDTNESTKKSNIDQSIASTSADDTLAESNLHPDDDEPPVEFEHGNEDMPYPHSVHSDAGEGSSDAGQFEVIEIDDEDEDVQAMFGDPRRRRFKKWHRGKEKSLMARQHNTGLKLFSPTNSSSQICPDMAATEQYEAMYQMSLCGTIPPPSPGFHRVLLDADTTVHRLILLEGKKERDCFVCSDRSQGNRGRKRTRHWCPACKVGCHERCEPYLVHQNDQGRSWNKKRI